MRHQLGSLADASMLGVGYATVNRIPRLHREASHDLGTSRAVRVLAYPAAVDLRTGYDGLFGLVKQGIGRDRLSGDLFLFVNARRKGCKMLVWDGTGLCIFQKRLERGCFASLWRDDGDIVTLTSSELALFVEGCELVGRRRLSPAVVVPAAPPST